MYINVFRIAIELNVSCSNIQLLYNKPNKALRIQVDYTGPFYSTREIAGQYFHCS